MVPKLRTQLDTAGGADEHLVARALITMKIDERRFVKTHANIKQTPGGGYTPSDIEVDMPADYHGPFKYQVLREKITEYYLSLVGPEGRLLRWSP